MIVYSFKEEVRLIVLLLCYSISLVTIYDLFGYIKKIKIKKFVQIIYTISIVYITYHFVFKLKSGYIPQYSIIILLVGIGIYYLILKRQIDHLFKEIKPLYIFLRKTFKVIFKPLTMVKTTFSLYKIKKVKNNNQNTLQK